jgi:hypothetical protein
LAREAIEDILDELLAAKDLENLIKEDLKRKFMKMKIVLGAMPEMLDDSRMEEVYNELQLNGAGILEATIKLINYNNKLSNEPINSWLQQINQLSKLKGLRYFAEMDVLFIPAEYLHYPFFDANRARFFNTATLYTEVVVNVNKGVKDFLKSVSWIPFFLQGCYEDFCCVCQSTGIQAVLQLQVRQREIGLQKLRQMGEGL